MAATQPQGLFASAAALPVLLLLLAMASPCFSLGEDATSTSRPLGWAPQDNRYLLAVCLKDGLSEQMTCLRKYFYIAGILNRTLLVPSTAVASAKDLQLPPWDWAQVVDFSRMRSCLEPLAGPKTVYLVPEILDLTKQPKISLSKVHCAVPGTPPSSSCFHQMAVAGLVEANKGKIELPHAQQDTVIQSPLADGKIVTVDDVAQAFGPIADEVLSLGDVAELNLETPGGVLSLASPSGECVNIWRPHASVMSFADGILDTLLGSQYAAVYWKRSSEKRASAADEEIPKQISELPVADVASRIRTKLKDTDVTVLYLATDARKADIETLEALLKDGKYGKKFAAILTLRQVLEDEEWLLQQFWSKHALLMEKQYKNGVALSLIDRVVCARAKFFLGTEGSSVTGDILHIRKNEGLENPPAMGSTF